MAVRTIKLGGNTTAGLAALAAALLLSGCSTTAVDSVLGSIGLQRIESQSPRTAKSTPRATTAPALATTWEGLYRGVLPCPDCDGLEIFLSLNNNGSYHLDIQQLDGSGKVSRKGVFTFNADETRIMLDSNGQGRVFEVLSGNRLRMLGTDGKAVTGANASRFILKKI